MGCSATVHAVSQVDLELDHPDLHRQIQNPTQFTDRQKRILQRTWKVIARDMTETGCRVFFRIFEIRPEVRNLFPGLQEDTTTEKLMENTVFKAHAARFMSAVGAIVASLDNPDDCLGPLLDELGETHWSFPGYESEYFDIFAQAMNTAWKQHLGIRYTSTAEETWRQLFNYMSETMTTGYQRAKSIANLRSNSIVSTHK